MAGDLPPSQLLPVAAPLGLWCVITLHQNTSAMDFNFWSRVVPSSRTVDFGFSLKEVPHHKWAPTHYHLEQLQADPFLVAPNELKFLALNFSSCWKHGIWSFAACGRFMQVFEHQTQVDQAWPCWCWHIWSPGSQEISLRHCGEILATPLRPG